MNINIGLLGFGSMGKTHSYAVHNMNYFYDAHPFNAKITKVCTSSLATAEKACDRYGIPQAAANEDEIIYSPDIDVIDICTPNIYHYETLKKAIDAGKHIYCEKPLCITYEQANEIAVLAEKRGIIGQIVFNYRFLSPVLRAKQLITDGRLGKILNFRCSYRHNSCMDVNKNAGWKQNRDICGGGVLFDLGSHAIDLMYYLCGEFDDVMGRGQIAFKTRKGPNGEDWTTNADEAFYIIARLKNGAYGTVEANKIAIGENDGLTFEIYGEKGALKFDLMEPNWLNFYDNTVSGGDLGGDRGFTKIECVGRFPNPGNAFPSVKAPIGWLRSHVGSMHSFLSSVAAGSKPVPSFSDAAHVQWVMEQAYKSDPDFRGYYGCCDSRE
jgi:predicted dehydrogenase